MVTVKGSEKKQRCGLVAVSQGECRAGTTTGVAFGGCGSEDAVWGGLCGESLPAGAVVAATELPFCELHAASVKARVTATIITSVLRVHFAEFSIFNSYQP